MSFMQLRNVLRKAFVNILVKFIRIKKLQLHFQNKLVEWDIVKSIKVDGRWKGTYCHNPKIHQTDKALLLC